MKKPSAMPKDAAEALAIQALTFIAADGERLGRFLAATGIGPAEIRAPAASRAFSPACSNTWPATRRCSQPSPPRRASSPPTSARRSRVLGGGQLGARGAVSFCRDCLADVPDKAARCPACGSPRLARHRELDTLTIAHIDCDAFYATIEKRDDPSLADKPVVVGGGKRGVVAAACYIARTYGIRSAMPMFEAKRRCPEAVVVKPNMAKYVGVGREVRRRMFELTPLVEPLSIDEAFLDLTGTERLHGMSAAKALARFARDVERDIGITVSIGLSANKFLAKIASDMDKPRGFAVLGAERGRGVSGAEAGRLHLRRRRGERGKAWRTTATG